MKQTDAIVVPGGGVRAGGVLPPWSQARFDLALQMDSGGVFLCLSQATPHLPPPIDGLGYPIQECVAGARYLTSRGVPTDRIRLEGLSLDTIGNAYFSRILHADPARWRTLLIITSDFHMRRTRAIFKWIYGIGPGQFNLQFAASPDAGMSPELRDSRRLREEKSLQNILALAANLTTLPDLHRWMFSKHDAYSAEGRLAVRPDPDKTTLETY
ncbi:MAG: YdcF family protein [Bryobacteraceae bacterium]|nr:YdcF family protein [Bryobacteraceae bacterium]